MAQENSTPIDLFCKIDVIPTYDELEYDVYRVFNDSYFEKRVQLDITARVNQLTEFKVSGYKDLTLHRTQAVLQSKYEIPDSGMLLTTRWMTDTSELRSKISSKIWDWVGMTGEFMFRPNCGERSAYVTGDMNYTKLGHATVQFGTGCMPNSYVASFDFVTNVCCFLFGLQSSFDTRRLRIGKFDLAGGFYSPSFKIISSLKSNRNLSTSVFQKFNEKLESGFQLQYDYTAKTSCATIAWVYKPWECSVIHAKLSTAKMLGFSFCQDIKPGIMLGFSAIFENWTSGVGKNSIGVCASFVV